MEDRSNIDLLEAIEKLQDDLSSSGNEEVSKLIVEGLSGLNGLTDGWALLLESLNSANEKFASSLSQQQSSKINKIKNKVHKVVYRA